MEKLSFPLVSLHNATARIGRAVVFNNLSFDIYPGEHLAVTGKNGSGKSTLLRLMHGDLRLPQEQEGTLFWNFTGVQDASPLAAKQHARLVSPSMQSTYIRRGWNINGMEVILSGLDNQYLFYSKPTQEETDRAEALAGSCGLSYLLAKAAASMSQGELRLVILLRAVIAAPKLLLLDEPLEGLSHAVRPKIISLLEATAHDGTTIVITAHRKEDVPLFISRGFSLPEGTLESPPFAGVTRELFLPSEESPLGASQGIPAPPTRRIFSSPCPLCAAFHEARELPLAQGIVPVNPHADVLFSMRGVQVFIHSVQVLFDINWQVAAGEHWIVSGNNGAGKSTLVRLLYGEEYAAFGGSVTWCDGTRPPLDILHKHVGYVSDGLQHGYGYDLTAKEVVISGISGSVGLYHAPDSEEEEIAGYWLDIFHLGHAADVPFFSLSSGTARRVLLARAMACAPSLLLLDEPCTGLDPQSRRQFLSGLNILADQGVQLIYVSHHASDTPDVFTHEMSLERGRVGFCGKRSPGC